MGGLSKFVRSGGESLGCGPGEGGDPGWREIGVSECGWWWRVQGGRCQTERYVVGHFRRDGMGFDPRWYQPQRY